MNDDVRSLLQHLGQSDFDYREFDLSEQIPDYWPVFQTVTGHPLLSCLPGARINRRISQAQPVADATPQTLATEAALKPADIPSEIGGRAIFRRYNHTAATPSAHIDENISALLRRLSVPRC